MSPSKKAVEQLKTCFLTWRLPKILFLSCQAWKALRSASCNFTETMIKGKGLLGHLNSGDPMNKHFLQLWDIRHPVQPIWHWLSYVLKGNIPLLLLFILLFLFIIILIIEVFLFPFCFLVVLLLFFLFILIFIISFLLQGVQGVQGAPLLLTAEISLKSRPSSARRFCTSGVILIQCQCGWEIIKGREWKSKGKKDEKQKDSF